MKVTIVVTYNIEASSVEEAKKKYHLTRPSFIEARLFVPIYQVVWTSFKGPIRGTAYDVDLDGLCYKATIKASSPVHVQALIYNSFPDAKFVLIEGVVD